MPSGASSNIVPITDDLLDCPMDYEAVAQKGTMLGSASFIVLDNTVDMAWLALKTTRFFKHESCGKCTPCREGTFWMLQILERINCNAAAKSDLDLLKPWPPRWPANACARWVNSPSLPCSPA